MERYRTEGFPRFTLGGYDGTDKKSIGGAKKLRRFLGFIDDYVFSVYPKRCRVNLGLLQAGKIVEAHILEFRELILQKGAFPNLTRP